VSASQRLLGVRHGDAPPPADDERVSILIVDDNPAKRLALKSVVIPLGHRIVEAGSGVAALRNVMAEDFAVILLDVRMPGMDGFETAALIRRRAASEMTPIIFITAFGEDEIVRVDRYAQGAVDFIFAPVEPEALRAKVTVFANLFVKARTLAAQSREVQASADRLLLLTDAAPIGIFHTDARNRYIYTNPPWTEITGIPAEAATGEHWDIILGPAPRPDAGVRASRARDPVELSHRFEIWRPDLSSRIVLVTSVPIRDREGAIDGWVGTVADVTAEAGAEAAMTAARDKATEASRLKSDFLTNMSHEIRTPMNGVIGMTDLLLETELDTYQREYAQTIRNSGEALLTIINDILDFSKIEAGKLVAEDVTFSPRVILESVLDLLAGSAHIKGLELLAEVNPGVPASMMGDPGRLRQVLTNLIGNAIKFTQSGEVMVRVEEIRDSETTTALRFEVTDTGDGITADKLATVFEPFIQADTSTSRKYGGTGLGLAISSQLVALMVGECGASSERGTGSTFWFTVQGDSETRTAGHPVAREQRLSGVTALIVDDSLAQVRVLSGYMRNWGMNVTTTDSGPAALAAIDAATAAGRPIEVAIIDQLMPDVSGRELIDRIRADWPRVPLLLMTSLGRDQGEGFESEAHSVTILTKPVHESNLLASLLAALGREGGRPLAAPLVEETAQMSGPGAGRILLAEDNPINQKVAVAMLSGAGYRIDTVWNGADAVRAASEHHYDAILMDCQMPELSGYEATAVIRGKEAGAARTPIIAMTAGARREDRERCIAEGMDGYLSKPVSKDALLALVARSIAERRP
jgi:two-component system sensor histidine kinase/response regulator